MRRVLLTGAGGQVGWELRRTLMPLGDVIAPTRDRLDLSDAASIRSVVDEVKPQLIVNAAAYTAVDNAETESERAMAINGIAPGVLAQEARRVGALLVHYSTDYVFDGSKSTAYAEDDVPKPINRYGATKWAGESAIREAGGRYLILRTSWVYGARGKNFLLTMRRLAAERDQLRIVSDQFGAPTWSRAIAETTAQVLVRCSLPNDRLDDGALQEATGTYHMTAAGSTSWFEFARAIFETAPLKNRPPPVLTPIGAVEYQSPAARPKNSVLSNAKLAQVFGLAMPDWRIQLRLCLEDMGVTP